MIQHLCHVHKFLQLTTTPLQLTVIYTFHFLVLKFVSNESIPRGEVCVFEGLTVYPMSMILKPRSEIFSIERWSFLGVMGVKYEGRLLGGTPCSIRL